MRKLQIIILFLVLINGAIFTMPREASSQQIELLASNTVNGAATGLGLGAATLGLQNSADYQDPLRIGLGFGTLFGIGVGVYDITRSEKGMDYYVSATFNDGRNSSVIVLLDTFYGAAAGAVVASAVTLILNEPVKYGLQYGASAGAWVGFGFGLVDAFMLAKQPGQMVATSTTAHRPSQAPGMLSLRTGGDIDIGLINPSTTSVRHIESGTLQNRRAFRLDLLNVSVSL